MKRCGRLLILFLALTALAPMRVYGQDPYHDPARVRAFADHLYQEGDFRRAAGEYQRWLFLADSAAPLDSVLFKTAICLRKSGEPQRATEIYQRLTRDFPRSPLLPAADYQWAKTLFDQQEYDRSIQIIDSAQTATAGSAEKLSALKTANLLCLQRWRLAREAAALPSDSENALPAMRELAAEAEHLPYKSGFKAAALSAIVPGLGKAYAKRPLDFTTTFVIVGLAGYWAYAGFHDGGTESLRGWSYSGIGGAFYLGGIYGSVVAVKRHNRELVEKLTERVRRLVPDE
jgi:tetratricopeptide (TPR) repeat protein